MTHARHLQRGMTMVEAIIVIVITGIIGSVVALFIRLPVQGYTDSVERAAATDLADASLRRMTRDLRLALPNSVRVGGAGSNWIEFLQTSGGLRYLADDDTNTSVPPAPWLDWENAARRTFTVVGGVSGDRHPPVAGDYLVVYNLGETQEPGNAYNCAGPCNRARIASVTTSTITLEANPFAAQAAAGVALTSPGRRAHVVTSAVTYGCDTATGRLTRYWDYPISATQQMPPAGAKSALLASGISQCQFRYANLASQRSGLIGISLTLAVGTEGALALEHQVHVDNTP